MNRLKELRKSSKIKQKDIANYLKVSVQAIINYEKDDKRLNPHILKKFSELYNVSIDYILGNDVNGKVVFTDEQQRAIKKLCNLNKEYFEIASNLIDDLDRKQEQQNTEISNQNKNTYNGNINFGSSTNNGNINF